MALQQRARRRRRVDHDRAAREQAERRGEQQPVLERLLLLATSLHRTLRFDAFGRASGLPSAHVSAHERAEVVAALLVVAVLVVGRAGGREQDDVAGPRRGARGRDGALEVAAVVQRHAGAAPAPAPIAAAVSPIR